MTSSTTMAPPPVARPVAVAVAPSGEVRRPARRRRRRRWLMATAAALVTVTMAAPPARAEIFDTATLLVILEYLETYLVPILEELLPLPGTIDGAVIEETLKEVGTATTSYLSGASPESIFARLFPRLLQVHSLDDASAWAAMRDLDRQARAAEGMRVDQAVLDDVAASATRADDYRLRNDLPLESVAAVGKLGNEIGMEASGTLKQIAEMTAESAQLEADERVRQDWARHQADEWEHEHVGDAGFWSGVRSWRPETLPPLGGGG